MHEIEYDEYLRRKNSIRYAGYCRACGDIFLDDEVRCACDTLLISMELDMTPVTNLRIWWDTSVQAYRMASPFNKDLVETFKKNIPHSDRSYDDQTKIWTFVERQLPAVQALLTLLNIKPTVITRAQAEAASASSSAPAVRRGTALDALALEFLRIVPYDCMLKAYRAAAMQLHPDRNPQSSMDKMSALNAAWDRLTKEVYNQ